MPQANEPHSTLMRRASGAACALALLSTASAFAQGDDHHEEHFHKNHIAALIGGMTPLAEKSQTSFALGADYERRI